MPAPVPNASAPSDLVSRLAARALAPTLLTLALAACGTGSPPADGGRTSPVDGTPSSGAATGDGETDRTPTAGAATPVDPGTVTLVPIAPMPSVPATGVPTPPVTTPIAPATDAPATDAAAPIEPASAGASGIDDGPLGCDAPPAEMQARALELINAARAEARVCGEAGAFAATGALGWDSRLEAAARTHSTDMAATGNFDHTGTDGSSAGDRIERAGYDWGEYAENIAAGQTSLEAAVAGWIRSSGHCRNLMAPGVSDVAVACVSNEDARFRRYWTNVLARPFQHGNRP